MHFYLFVFCKTPGCTARSFVKHIEFPTNDLQIDIPDCWFPISAVCGAFNIEVANGRVREARICYGGMAATPKRARNVEAVLIGQAWTLATVMAALPAFDRDFTPISDLRGSAAYRSQAAKNLLVKYFHETQRPRSGTRLIGREAAF